MEISKQSRLIYRLRGWRAAAIVLPKVIPAIHHFSTASRSGGVFKDFLCDRSSGGVGKPGGRGEGWCWGESFTQHRPHHHHHRLNPIQAFSRLQHPSLIFPAHHPRIPARPVLLLPRIWGRETCMRGWWWWGCRQRRDRLLPSLIVLGAHGSEISSSKHLI